MVMGKEKARRPKLNKIPVPQFPFGPGIFVTVSPGQWDSIHAAAYSSGHTLLEIDEINSAEVIVAAYRKETKP